MSTLACRPLRCRAALPFTTLAMALALVATSCSSDAGGTLGDAAQGPDGADAVGGGDGAQGADADFTPQPTPAAVRVVLPDDVTWPTTGLRVVTGLDDRPVGAGGQATVTVGGQGDSLALVLDGEGNLVLLGFVDPAETRTLDAASTAAAMLWLAFNAYALPPEARVEVLRLLEAHPYTDQLARRFAWELKTDPRALTGPNEAVLGELQNTMLLISQIPLEGERDTRGAPATGEADNNASVLVEPTAPQSGVLVGPNLGGNGLQVTNLSRRTAWYWVYRTGFEGEDGAATEVSPPELVEEGFVQSTNGLTGTVGTLYQAFTGGLDFGPKVLEPVPLNVPDGQRRVFYEVIVGGAHIPFRSKTHSWFNPNDARHAAWKTRADLMTTVSFVRDVLAPAVFSLVLPIKGAVQGADDFPTWESLALLVAAQVPAVSVQLADGDYRGALQTVLLAMANNTELRNGVAQAALRALAGGLTSGAEQVMEEIAKANFMVAAADLGVAAADIALVVSDLSDANALERWEVSAVRAKVLLQATRTSFDPLHLDAVLTATVPGARPNERFCFLWELDGPGELSPFLPGPSTGPKVQVTGDPDLMFLIDSGSLVDGALAVVTVKAYVNEDPTGQGCTFPPQGELVGEGRLGLTSSKVEHDPCPPERFDLAFWQAEKGGLSMSASGGYGGVVTVTVTIPPDPEISGGYRDVSIYVPRPASYDVEAVSVSGDVKWVSSVKKETWMQDIRRDEVAGPIMFYDIADVRIHAVGTVTVSMQTTRTEKDCESGPGSPPCCPHWVSDANVGTVLVGPFVFAESYGVGRTVDLVIPN